MHGLGRLITFQVYPPWLSLENQLSKTEKKNWSSSLHFGWYLWVVTVNPEVRFGISPGLEWSGSWKMIRKKKNSADKGWSLAAATLGIGVHQMGNRKKFILFVNQCWIAPVGRGGGGSLQWGDQDPWRLPSFENVQYYRHTKLSLFSQKRKNGGRNQLCVSWCGAGEGQVVSKRKKKLNMPNPPNCN